MSLYAAYNCTDSGKINSGKNFFHFYEKLAQQKSTDSYQSKRGHPSEEIFLCSEYFEWACFGKNWAIQAQVLYTSSSRKIDLLTVSLSLDTRAITRAQAQIDLDE